MRRLTHLDPAWIATTVGRFGMGIQFLCPCARCAGAGITLLVWFANPIDGGPAASAPLEPLPRWHVLGETYTFQTLSIIPSIDASASGHWHGFVVNGDCIDAPDPPDA